MKSFEEAQQEVVDNFKTKLSGVCKSVLADFYCDVSPYAETDAHTNFTNMLRDELKEYFCKDISERWDHHSWAATIRAKLLSDHRDVLQNKIIEDLHGKIESLKNELHNAYSRRL